MELYDRIKSRRQDLKMTQAELADLLGYSDRSTIAKIERGVNDISQSRISDFADALETTPAYLLGWTDDPYDYDSDPDGLLDTIPSSMMRPWRDANLSNAEIWRRYQAIQDDSFREAMKSPAPAIPFIRVPRVGAIACGEPILADQNIEGYDQVPAWTHCDFTLVCKGDSMIGARIFDGDIVCIRSQPEVESGEIAAVQVGEDEATLKRVKIYPDHIVLEPENPNYRPMTFWDEEMAKVKILGKATHFISEVR